MSWVLRFYETEYSIVTSATVTSEHGTEVSMVTILKLIFETNGKTFNLGVINNKTNDTSPDEPDNDKPKPNTCDLICELQKKIDDFLNTIKKSFELIGLISGIVLIIVAFIFGLKH